MKNLIQRFGLGPLVAAAVVSVGCADRGQYCGSCRQYNPQQGAIIYHNGPMQGIVQPGTAQPYNTHPEYVPEDSETPLVELPPKPEAVENPILVVPGPKLDPINPNTDMPSWPGHKLNDPNADPGMPSKDVPYPAI